MGCMSTARPGLRERKKRQTREAIQNHALRLYQEQGYDATTIEQIADAADVSPSTFFRYFPTKSETVLYDRLDPVFVDMLLRQSPDKSLPTAIRDAMRETLEGLGAEGLALEVTRMRLVAEVPELRGAAAQNIDSSVPVFVEAIAQRIGRDPDDEDVLMWVGAMTGVILVALFRALSREEDPLAAIDRATSYLADGLQL